MQENKKEQQQKQDNTKQQSSHTNELRNLSEIDQQEGDMNNGELGGNFREDPNIVINKNLENSPEH